MIQVDSSCAQSMNQSQIMGRDHDSHADLIERFEPGHNFAGGGGIKVTGRLVGEKNCWTINDRPSNTKTLLLAARQSYRPSFLAPQQADLVESGPHPARDFAPRETGDHQRQR